MTLSRIQIVTLYQLQQRYQQWPRLNQSIDKSWKDSCLEAIPKNSK